MALCPNFQTIFQVPKEEIQPSAVLVAISSEKRRILQAVDSETHSPPQKKEYLAPYRLSVTIGGELRTRRKQEVDISIFYVTLVHEMSMRFPVPALSPTPPMARDGACAA